MVSAQCLTRLTQFETERLALRQGQQGLGLERRDGSLEQNQRRQAQEDEETKEIGRRRDEHGR